MTNFPDGTAVAVEIKKLIEQDSALSYEERMSTRMVKSAAFLPEGDFCGWQATVPVEGIVEMQAFGSSAVSTCDLDWMLERVALTGPNPMQSNARSGSEAENTLYDLTFPLVQGNKHIGFGSGQVTAGIANAMWPMTYFHQFKELVHALRKTGAILRYVVGCASGEEANRYKAALARNWSCPGISAEEYIGRPVVARLMLLLPSPPSLQLRTVLAEDISEIQIQYIGPMKEKLCQDLWENPLLGAPTLPSMAARVISLEPILINERIEGVLSCRRPVTPIFSQHENPKCRRSIQIGQAVDTAGVQRPIYIGEDDIRRHWQIVGQTGTGKSSLLASTILSAIKNGYGLTFFDPHGTTIEQTLKLLPAKYVGRVRVVHIGDENSPVPLSMWSSDDPEKEEKTINDLCQLFGEIFDPNHQGYVGPRWERWFSTFAKGSIALLGRRASFESIITLSQSKENMRKLYDHIKAAHPALADVIKDEYGTSGSSDFQELINWCVSKLQRVTAISQLRNTLGAGANALNFQETVDTDKVTLIDLAVPTIGMHAARIVGTLILMQFWNAILGRENRAKTHLLFIDEAHLFQTNPLPQMLAEGRKFGLGIVMAHQHCGQLNREVLDALEANSANFTAFRLSAKDAYVAALKLDDVRFNTYLCRLDEFCSVASLSVGGRQTPPFSLQVERTHKKRACPGTADEVEKRSRDELVEPYRGLRPLRYDDILRILDSDGSAQEECDDVLFPAPPVPERPGWLLKWNSQSEKCDDEDPDFLVGYVDFVDCMEEE